MSEKGLKVSLGMMKGERERDVAKLWGGARKGRQKEGAFGEGQRTGSAETDVEEMIGMDSSRGRDGGEVVADDGCDA